MSDINANIGVNFNTAQALAELKNLQRQLSQFHTSISRTSESAAIAQKNLQTNLLNSVNATGNFIAQMGVIKTSTESFTHALENNKLSMREYFRYAGGASKTFGTLFTNEFNTIGKVAEERVKRLQTQYIKMGRDTTGAMKAMAIMPANLDMNSLSTKTQIAAQKQAIFNQLLKQGSTQLLNFGKNTQWAGRQLMVGFTVPLAAFGSTAIKAFQDIEASAIKFKKVYGDLGTSQQETDAMLSQIRSIADAYTKYGVAVKDTISLSADAAAAGYKNADLIAQTNSATKLSILGQINQQQALSTTISLQSAFGISADKLAGTIDFLNAVENQTVVSLDDITTAIPKVAPVIKQLGGDVKDLSFFLTAMKEGGVNAAEGANALKSGLASLINPTTKAKEMLKGLGIDIVGIIQKDKGNLKQTILDVGAALDTLAPLTRAKAIETMFGKFQFARMSTLFDNINKQGSQASRVLDLMGMSASDLASITDKELGVQGASSLTKFKGAIEKLKATLAPVGEVFMKIFTPIINSIGGLLDKFNHLSDGAKKAIGIIVAVIGGLGPIALMTFGLLANAFANSIKLFATLRAGYQRLTGGSKDLGEQTQYLTTEQLDAAAAAHSLDQSHAKLIQTFTAEAGAVNSLRSAYSRATIAAEAFKVANPGMMVPNRKKYANGGIISGPGTGTSDSIPAMVSNGESIISAKQTKKYGTLINAIISDNIPGYANSKRAPSFFSQARIDEVFRNLGLEDTARLRIPLPISSPSYSVSGIMAPKEVNTKKGGIGMDKAYLSSNQGRAALNASIQAEIESLGVNAKRAAEVLKHIAPQLDKAVTEFDDTIEGWKTASTKAIKDIESSPVLTKEEKNAIRKRLAPIDPNDYTVTSDPVLEIKKQGSKGSKGKGTPRNERKDSTYLVNRQKQILEEQGYNTEGLVFAHMPGYEKIQGQQRAIMRPPTSGGKVLQGEALAKAEELRNRYLLNQGMTQAELEAIALQDAKAYSAAIEKGTKDIYVKSRKRKSPHPLASQDGKDDAIAYDTAVQKSIARNQRNIARRSGGTSALIPSVSIGNVGGSDEVKKTGNNLSTLNNRLMGASFALTTISSMGSMAGGALGELSNQVMKYSGLLFGLMSVTQLLTKQQFLALTAGRVGVAKSMVANVVAEGAGSMAGRAGMMGSLARVGVFAKSLLGLTNPIGLTITALTAGLAVWKLVSAARERERQAIEGLGNAANISAGQIAKLGSAFGVNPYKGTLETFKPTVVANKEQRTAIQQARQALSGDKEYQNDVKALKGSNAAQGKRMLAARASKLLGAGFAQDQVQAIINAMEEDAGKVKLNFKVKSIDLTSKEGKAGLKKNVDSVIKDYQNAYSKGLTKTTRQVSVRNTTATITEEFMSKDLKTKLKTAGGEYAAFFTSLNNQFEQGKISAADLSTNFDTLAGSIGGLTKDQQAKLIPEIFGAINEKLVPLAAGLSDSAHQFDLLKAAMAGLPAEEIQAYAKALAVLENPKASASAIAKATAAVAAVQADILKKTTAQEKSNKTNGTIEGSGDGKKSVYQTAKEQIVANTKAIVYQAQAYNLLRKAKLSVKDATDLASDSVIAEALATTKSASARKVLIALLQKYNKEKKTQTQLDAGKDIVNQSQDIEAQLSAYKKLKAAGIDAKSALDLASNVNYAGLINSTKTGSKNWKEIVAQAKEYINLKSEIENMDVGGAAVASAQKKVDDLLTQFQGQKDAADTQFALREKAVEDKYAAQIKSGQEAVDAAQSNVDAINAQIADAEHAMALAQHAIDLKQHDIDMNNELIDQYNQQIDALQRQSDINYGKPLQALQDESDLLSHNLSLIDHQAEAINKQYDDQAAALEQVNKLNQEAIQQGKSKISIADALAQGDISAAAQAIQDLRAQNAATAGQNQSSMLDAARKQSLDSLTAGGMTKAQIEARQWEIQQKSWDLQQKQKEIEAQIVLIKETKIVPLEQANLKLQNEITVAKHDIYLQEQAIWDMQNKQLYNAQKDLEAKQAALKKIEDLKQAELDKITEEKKAWDNLQLQIDAARLKQQGFNGDIQTAITLVNQLAAAYAALAAAQAAAAQAAAATGSAGGSGNGSAGTPTADAIISAGQKAASAVDNGSIKGAMAADKIAGSVVDKLTVLNGGPLTGAQIVAARKGVLGYLSTGGIVPQYFANGGGAKGTDTVPAYLTPGEFVVNKKASKVFAPLLQAINTGEFPSFKIDRKISTPSYNTGQDSGRISTAVMPRNNTPIQSDNSNTVYNYSLNFNINGDKVNSKEIANTVINRIKELQNQQVRGQVRL
jgi:TP901 family phage tail tape measure protein